MVRNNFEIPTIVGKTSKGNLYVLTKMEMKRDEEVDSNIKNVKMRTKH